MWTFSYHRPTSLIYLEPVLYLSVKDAVSSGSMPEMFADKLIIDRNPQLSNHPHGICVLMLAHYSNSLRCYMNTSDTYYRSPAAWCSPRHVRRLSKLP